MKESKKNQEMKVYGRSACLTLFKKRPEDIIRAYVTQDGVFEFKELIKYCANKKLAYHIVEKEELETITKAIHHEGIALVVKTKKLPTLKDLFSEKGRILILALEEVENPHNLGAIMRTAAHFGITGIIYQAKVPVAQTASAYRTSEGGAESVPAIQITEWSQALDLAKSKGLKCFATSSHVGESLFKTNFPDKTLLFMGAEGAGLSKRFLQGMEGIQIPGTGEVESLNVSNATAAILSEWYRQGQ
ncbi:MAG: TrmH family RNA methyltransferase [Bacteriovoracaceae bacterium]